MHFVFFFVEVFGSIYVQKNNTKCTMSREIWRTNWLCMQSGL